MAVAEIIEFTHKDNTYRYTTSRKSQAIAGKIFSPVAANRSVVVKSESDSRDLEIELSADNEVAMLFRDRVPDATVTVKVSRIKQGVEHTYFTGHVSGVSFSAGVGATTRATITCTSIIARLDSQGLGYNYTAGCGHLLYSPQCGLSFASNADTIVIQSITSNGFTLHSEDLIGKPEGYYVSGLLEFSGTYAMITGYDPTAGTITLFASVAGLKQGDTVRVARGCNRSIEDCKKLGNIDNFFGFPWIPTKDPWRSGIMKPKNIFN